jgi:spoIIIJ-associated protein
MEWVETTGRTVEEAKDAALDQLGVDEQDAEFEIVEEPRFGLFGRLRSEARVRARVRPTKPRPKEERRDRRGRRRGPGGDGPSGSDDPAAAPSAPRSSARRSPERDATAATRTPAPPRAGPDVADSDTAGASDDAEPAARSTPRRRSGTGPAAAGAPRAPRSGRDPQQSDDELTMSPGGGMDVSLEEQGDVAREFLDGLTERMNLEAEVVISQPEEETIELNLLGQDLGLLIGPKGTTLLAIQDLTRTVVQRKTSAGNGRILVDVSGYRRKRKDALARFSRQVAEEVQASGTRRALEPMSAADRKIVHDTVNDVEGVMTISEGEDPHRRVVILPVSADE